jgi:hypothetical protein
MSFGGYAITFWRVFLPHSLFFYFKDGGCRFPETSVHFYQPICRQTPKNDNFVTAVKILIYLFIRIFCGFYNRGSNKIIIYLITF